RSSGATATRPAGVREPCPDQRSTPPALSITCRCGLPWRRGGEGRDDAPGYVTRTNATADALSRYHGRPGSTARSRRRSSWHFLPQILPGTSVPRQRAAGQIPPKRTETPVMCGSCGSAPTIENRTERRFLVALGRHCC